MIHALATSWNSISEKQLIRLFTFLSCILACQIIYIQHGWINDDSVLYFEMARLISFGQWKEALSLFNWPLYPLLLSAMHQVFHLGIQLSAQILDVIFFAITTFTFLKLIQLAGGNKLAIVSGGFILFTSSYIVGDVLPMLLRDQGFWAMFLTSIVFFVEYYRHQKLEDAIYWQVFAIAAVLFRIEAITFMAGLPLILFYKSTKTFKDNFAIYVKANSLPFVALMILSALLLLPNIHLSDYGRLQEVATIFPRMMTVIADTFKVKAAVMSKDVLGHFLADYGLMGLVLTLASIIVINACTLLSWPVISIIGLNKAITKRAYYLPSLAIQEDTLRIFSWICILALINAIVIISTVFVLSGRYLISLILILYIFAAFHFASLFQFFSNPNNYKTWQRWFFTAMLIVMALIGIKSLLPKQAGYIYEQEAAAYLKAQHISNEHVFYVSPRLRYFAGSPYNGRGYDYWEYTKTAIDNGSIYSFDYLMINMNIDNSIKDREKFLNQSLKGYQVVKEFYGYRNKKKVVLYSKIKQ